MSAFAKSLIIKAQEDLNVAKQHLHDEKQHDLVGYNLAQACEKFLKALCEMKNIDYPRDEAGHDLDALMEILEENNFAAISSHADIVDLTPYNALKTVIPVDDRLDLIEMYDSVENLKKLVGDQLKFL